MRIKRNTLNVIIVIAALVIGLISMLKISNDAKITQFVNERNTFCANLSIELGKQEGITNCFCYFEGFKTGEEKVDSQTLPLCACECMINGTSQKIGILETRA